MVLFPGYIGGQRVEIGILEAAASGNVSIIRRWLEDGGDANEEITAGPWDYPRANLLHYVAGVSNGAVAEEGRLAIVRLLLAHGANANAIANRPQNTPLLIAAIHQRAEMCQLLCEAGADPNYVRAPSGDFPLWFAIRDPDVVRVLLRFGADPSLTKTCRHGENYLVVTPEMKAEREANQQDIFHDASVRAKFRESARLLAEARVRPLFRAVFSLRALCHRGRATPTFESPAAFSLLVFAPTSRPRTRAAWRRAPPGLPDPLAHLVCQFWLGEPPRRANRHAAADTPSSE